MAVLQGIFEGPDGLPKDGATTKLWTLAQFGGTQPAKDTALPSGSPVQTLSGGTGTAYGGNGHWRFSGVTAGDYVISVEWNGSRVYDSRTVPADSTLRDSDYFGLSTGGTGAANASALNAAFADTSVGVLIIKPGVYTVAGSLTINNRTGLLILGYGATIQWSGTGTSTSPVAINLTGTCRDLSIRGLRFLGDGTAANYHGGVKILAGQSIEGLSIQECHFETVTNGVWITNASFLTLHIKIAGNQFEDIVGTGAGQGRAVVVNGTSGDHLDLTIEKNSFDQTDLHAVEILAGIGIAVRNNYFANHRNATSTGGQVPAITCAPTASAVEKLSITGNAFHACSDGMIGVIPAGAAVKRLTIEGNHCALAVTDEPEITIGSTTPAASGTVEAFTVRGNVLVRSGMTSPALLINSGLEGVVTDNVIQALLLTAANTPMISFAGSGDSGGSSTYSDDLLVANNQGVATLSGGTAVGIEFGADFCTSQISLRAENNAFFGVAAFFRGAANVQNDALSIGSHAYGAATPGPTFDSASNPLEVSLYAVTLLAGLRLGSPKRITGNTTLRPWETYVIVTTGASDVTVTLPAISGSRSVTDVADGQIVVIAKADTGAGRVLIDAAGTEIVMWAGAGSARAMLGKLHSSITLIADNTNSAWWVIGSNRLNQPHVWKSITNADSPYALLDTDETIRADTSAGNIEIDLLATTNRDGRRIRIFRPSAANTLTIDPDGTETIDGGGAGAAVTLEAQANNWWDYEIASGEWKRVGGRYT